MPSKRTPQSGQSTQPPQPAANQDSSPRKLLQNRKILGGAIGGGLLLVIGIGWVLLSGPAKPSKNLTDGGDETADDASEGAKRKSRPGGAEFHGVPLTPPEFKTVLCRVYTPEPGFFVLVDGEAARKKTGDKLMTPCELGITPGNHTLAVVKKGFKDASNEVLVTDGHTFEFTPMFEPFAAPTGYFASRFSRAEVGQELPLLSLNTDGKVLDPFVAADGLSIWFAGDREGKKGIFVARRATVLDEFNAPELLPATRGTTLPTGPSVTADELLVAYTVLDEARIWGVARESKDVPFGERKLLKFSDRDGDLWRSVQISADGKHMYCAQERQEAVRPFVTSRKTIDQKFAGKWSPVRMPGGHPCLSADGLRQYVFDGTTLRRSSRQNMGDDWSEPEAIAEVTLKNYVHRPAHRQIFVSNDEQWLYYTDDPQGGGNLYTVRISAGPGWGFVAQGKSIAQKEIAVASSESPDAKPDAAPETTEKPAKPEQPAAAPEPAVDPRTRPLPYAELRAKLDGLLAKADMSGAAALIASAQADRQFAQDAEQIKWDAEELGLVQKFWTDVEQVLGKMKPGDPIRIGPLQMQFKSFAAGKISADASGKLITKELREMTSSDLVAIADRGIDKASEPAQLQVAAFLSCDAKVRPQTLVARLQRAGTGGKDFLARQTQRKLHLIQREFERENISAGLKMVDQLVAASPKSEMAAQAQALRDKLYVQLEWRPVGGQKWDLSKPGEYAATGTRAADSFLVSPREYANFELSLEFRTTDATAQGGVWFRYKTGSTLRGNAFKVQIANDFDLRNNPDRFSTGALLGIRGPQTNNVKKAGEWNTLLVRAVGERLRVAVNGMEVLDTPLSDPNIGKEGYVCLDGVQPGIAYRRILLYELPPGVSK